MMNRRQFLGFCAATCVAANAAAAELRAKLKCRPVISGTLWWCSAEQSKTWGRGGWLKELRQQQDLGFDLLWLANAPALLQVEEFPLRRLLDLCAERKMQVIVDTGSTPKWYEPLDLKKETELCRKNITALAEQTASHPAFRAWYIPHEIYMDWAAMDAYVSELYPALVDMCKKAAARPVTLSPFFILDRTKVFGNFRYNEPAEYGEYWARLIKKSGLDIVMLQDSGEHFSYVTDEQRRPFYQAMSQACQENGARFWANVEVAEMECGSIEEYVNRYGRVHHSVAKAIPWRPVPIERLRTKLSLAAEFAEQIVSWGYQEFCRPALGAKAAEWFNEYRNYYRATLTGNH